MFAELLKPLGDIILLFLLTNLFIFSCIFWALSFLGEYFFSKKEQIAKKQFYECGFKTLSDINIVFNLNFSMICVFLILYDIEFTLLFPAAFNAASLSLSSYTILCLFIVLIILSLFYDLQHNAINWQV